MSENHMPYANIILLQAKLHKTIQIYNTNEFNNADMMELMLLCDLVNTCLIFEKDYRDKLDMLVAKYNAECAELEDKITEDEVQRAVSLYIRFFT